MRVAAGGVTWAEFINPEFRLRPAAPAISSAYIPPTISSKGGPPRGPSGGPLDVLESADAAAANETQNPKSLAAANALIPDIITKKSSIW